MRALLPLLVAIAVVGCERDETTSLAPSASASAKQPPATLERPLAAMPAFDLVGSGDHATLVWADDDAVRALSIASDGASLREVKLADATQVIEIAAAAGNGLGAAWIAGERLVTTVVDLDTLQGPEPVVSGGVSVKISERRGRLAMASAPDGRLTLFAQGRDEPCEEGGETPCATFVGHRLPADGSDDHRPALTVPHPCGMPIVGFASTDNYFHYAVCNVEKGKETTTLFTAQAQPSYAQVLNLLEGCSPIGAATHGGELWLTARCGQHRAGVMAQGVDWLKVPHDMSKAKVVCTKAGEMKLSLGVRVAPITNLHAVQGLATLLPANIAPRGARAAVIAKTLVVASPTPNRVEVRRYRCAGPVLLPSP